MLSGDNGILQKATDAKTNTDNAQIQEQINLAYHSALVNGQGELTETLLETELKNEFNKTTLDEGWLDKTSKAGKWIISIDNVSLEVPAGVGEIDDSTKLYNALKDKTPQEIVNGIIVDGIKTNFIGASGSDATIEYNNQKYIVSLDSNDTVVEVKKVDIGVANNIYFTLNGNQYIAINGQTWYEWACNSEEDVPINGAIKNHSLKEIILQTYSSNGENGLICVTDYTRNPSTYGNNNMTRIASINKNEIRLALAQAISLVDSHGNVQSCNTKINAGESYTIE